MVAELYQEEVHGQGAVEGLGKDEKRERVCDVEEGGGQREGEVITLAIRTTDRLQNI